MTTAQELVQKVREVAHAVAFQSGTGSLECAGMIMSCLARKPELIDRFMREGSGLIVDGVISVGRGEFFYHAMDNTVRPASDAAKAETIRQLKRNAREGQR